MAIRLVTLDCANTLLRGRWDPVGFALWAAREAGLCLPARAGETYGALLRTRYPDVLAANRTGDFDLMQKEYVLLGREWLSGLDVDPDLSEEVVDASERLLTEPKHGLFEPFSDTIPALTALRERGVRLAVVSNWDVSLERVLKAHRLHSLVDAVYASLVVGAEKPDPAMIHLAMGAVGVGARETLHVGDDPIDDLGAAQNAGVLGLLLRREGAIHDPQSTIRSLMEVLEWID